MQWEITVSREKIESLKYIEKLKIFKFVSQAEPMSKKQNPALEENETSEKEK